MLMSSYGVKTMLNGAIHRLRREGGALRRETWAIAREYVLVWRERHGKPRDSASLLSRQFRYGAFSR